MRYKIHIVLILIVLVITFHVRGQKLDSLLKELNNHTKEDTVKLKLLNNLSGEYQNIDPKKGIETADAAIALAKKLYKQREAAYGYMMKGENYNKAGALNNQALECFQKALTDFTQVDSRKDIARCTNDLGNTYTSLANYPKALDYFQQALGINKELGDTRGMGINLSNIGVVYFRLSEYPKALEYQQRALAFSQQAGDIRGIANRFQRIGIVYRNLGDYPKALENYQKSLKTNEQLNYKPGIAANLAEIGNLYNLLPDSTLALEYLQKALNIYQELNKKEDIAITDQNIGIIYRYKRDYSTALKYDLNALDMARQLGNESLEESCLVTVGVVYHFLENYAKALGYYKRSLAIAEKLQTKENVLSNINNIAEVYRDAPDSVLVKEGIAPVNRYTVVLEYFNKALQIAEQIGSLPLQRDVWHNINITYEKRNNSSKALDSYKKFIRLRDSIINNDKEKKITRLVIQYEFDKKDDSIKLQQQLAYQKLRQQVLLTKQEQQQLQLRQKELALANKEKDLQNLAYLKTQADLQNEQLEKKGKEKQLTLSEKEKELQQTIVKTLTQQKNLDALKQQQQWFYVITGLALLGLGSIYFFYRTRLHEGRMKTAMAAERIEQQQKEAEFQRKLGDISLSALRSQMNPHFIFNCLNSIKLYTTQNDTVAASEYLTKFSRLIRLVLENSRNDRISLAAELDALRLYMEMETMRFKEKLKYNISVGKEVDKDYIEIPPLLLQPYVENAIWHGLMQKEEGGMIDISISTKAGGSMLVIEITDNGIGRVKSAELKSKTATKHKSYGMKVTSERLELINRVYRTGANVTVDDLTDINGKPSGTRVTILIPIET